MRKSKEVDMYDLNGVYLKTFNSQTEAAKHLGTNKSNISSSCRDVIRQIKGFIFVYKGGDINSRKKRVWDKQPVRLIKNNKTVKIFESYFQCALYLRKKGFETVCSTQVSNAVKRKCFIRGFKAELV